jgi:hypothetical protein
MTTIKGTVKNRQVVVEVPADWPEGCEVRIEPITEADVEDDGPAPPEVIAARLALLDQIEPGWLSPEDEAVWKGRFRLRRSSKKTTFYEWSEKFRRKASKEHDGSRALTMRP